MLRGAPSWDLQVELLLTTAHVHGMALERYQGQGERWTGSSGKVESPTSPGGVQGVALGVCAGFEWRFWIDLRAKAME